MSSKTPEKKVTAAGFTAAVTGLILYFLAQTSVVAAMDPVTSGFLGVVVLGVVTFAAGYFTRNTGGEHRADERGATDVQQAACVVVVLVLAAVAAAVLLT